MCFDLIFMGFYAPKLFLDICIKSSGHWSATAFIRFLGNFVTPTLIPLFPHLSLTFQTSKLRRYSFFKKMHLNVNSLNFQQLLFL